MDRDEGKDTASVHHPLTVRVEVSQSIGKVSTGHEGLQLSSAKCEHTYYISDDEGDHGLEMFSAFIPSSSPPGLMSEALLPGLPETLSPPSEPEGPGRPKKRTKKAKRGSIKFQYDSDLDSVLSDAAPTATLIELADSTLVELADSIASPAGTDENESDKENIGESILGRAAQEEEEKLMEAVESEILEVSGDCDRNDSPASIFLSSSEKESVDGDEYGITTPNTSISEEAEEGEIDDDWKDEERSIGLGKNFRDAKADSDSGSKRMASESSKKHGADHKVAEEEVGLVNACEPAGSPSLSVVDLSQRSISALKEMHTEPEVILDSPSHAADIVIEERAQDSPGGLSAKLAQPLNFSKGTQMLVASKDFGTQAEEAETDNSQPDIETVHLLGVADQLEQQPGLGTKRKREIGDEEAAIIHADSRVAEARPKRLRRGIPWKSALSHTASLAVGAAAALAALALMPDLDD